MTETNQPGCEFCREPANRPDYEFVCPYCSRRWSAASHADYAAQAEAAEREADWAQASAHWYRAAELADDEEQYKRYLEAAARCDREVEAVVDALLADIARRELDVPTLEVRRSDSLDFHEVGVTALHRALWSAYRAGRDVAK